MTPTDPDTTRPNGVTDMLLVRHAQSTWNEEKRWQGQADPPLSDFGRHQASVAAQSVGAVDAVVASPQERAAGTAAIISEHIGVGPVALVDGLRERSAGVWSGLTRVEIERKWPGWVEDGRRPEGWEPDSEMMPRVMDALDSICTEFAGATVLVVSHGGVIIALEQHLGVNEARIPNLHGRVVQSTAGGYRGGERLQLLPDDLRTGAESNRV